VEFSPYVPAVIGTLRIVDAGTLAYDHKYVDRSRLTALIDKSVADDILSCGMDMSPMLPCEHCIHRRSPLDHPDTPFCADDAGAASSHGLMKSRGSESVI